MNLQAWPAWLVCLVLLAAALAAGLLMSAGLLLVARRVGVPGERDIDDALLRHGARPLRLLLPTLAARIVLPAAPVGATAAGVIGHLLVLLLIAALAWLALALIEAAAEVISGRFRTDVPDNLSARQVQTQVQILRRVAWVVVGVVALSAALMTFPDIRRIGISLFASAGVAGLVVGFAARPTLSNLVAGVQLALSQPIRLDDVVVVEGEWGRIEEIRLTYVVVRIWDERRLVLPTSYFLETPFQNWTRTSAQLLGTAYLYADYSLPVEETREALARILEETDLWDGRAWTLQVTDTTERTVQVRALMSARDAGTTWELRCHVRERLLAWLQAEHPEALPRVRVQAAGEPRPAAEASPDGPAHLM
ncbi:MAG TPA: mechanosensitive ion channel domain-containing protein [Gemmatimonadota bacterium]|nr:mechanosensitive ion channel domain-containing protein [Gemmatimonadota bacterium]